MCLTTLGNNPMNGIHSKNAYNATWFYKTVSDRDVGPQEYAIEYGKNLGHTLFFARQEGKANYWCYGSYASLEDFSQALGTNNAHFYEIITEHVYPRFYMDIDGETDCLDDILDIVCSGFQEEFGIAVTKDDFGISTANGVSDFGGKKNIMKYSAHVICNKPEVVFKSKNDILNFVTKYHHSGVDKRVYTKNRLLKTIHQSKCGNERIQTPLSGGYAEHLVTYLSFVPDPEKLLEMKTETKTKQGKTVSKLETLKDVTELVDCLSDERADDELAWMSVGWCLHNIHGLSDTDALNLWIEFSKRSDKFTEG